MEAQFNTHTNNLYISIAGIDKSALNKKCLSNDGFILKYNA